MINKINRIKLIIWFMIIIAIFYNFIFYSNAEEGMNNVELEITKEYLPNADNTVTVIIHSNVELADTKPTWTLSADKLTYTKIFDTNMIYTTSVQDINGNVKNISINITQVDDVGPNITMEYIPNADNTVTVIMHSNEQLRDTKPTWTLSADKLTYTKIFDTNITYTTTVEDIYGNVTDVPISVINIKNIGLEITMEYILNADNTVTAIMHSNQQLEDTKPTWTLSSDKKSYSKIFNENMNYSTDVKDIYGNTTSVIIDITQIITIEYVKNTDDTVTAIMHSNIGFKDTKPTWTLSSDKKSYSKIFCENRNYSTEVTDIYENSTNVMIEINQIELPLNITIQYNRNSDNTITAIMYANNQLADTKPTWNLSSDKKSYSKIFSENMYYSTDVTDIYGNTTSVIIDITQIITIEYVKNDDNTVTAIMHSNIGFKDTKPTWTLSSDKKSYSKIFSENMNYSTEVTDIYGNSTNVLIKIEIPKSSNFLNLDEARYPGYKALLQQLQNAHPNWIITIKYTGLDWKNAINGEDTIDRVVKQGQLVDSPKSLTNYTNEWKNGDTQYGTGWYRASRAAIAYMMDPRNSLKEAWIFQFQDLTSTAGTYSDISNMIAGTFLTKYTSTTTDSIINTILSASRTYNISPFHIVSRILQEQTNGWSTNGYSYNGRTVYNLFNIGATGSTDAEIIEKGAQYAYDHHWWTPELCIEGSVSFLNSGYFSRGQTTMYFQKYNVVNTSSLYSNQYMQNIRAANDEGNITYKSYRNNGLLDSQFEFVIPVYENMPVTACLRPAQ